MNKNRNFTRPNYTVYHLHDETSLLDSCTNFKLYVDKAVELGQTAIAFTNHGYAYNWVEKKMYCDKNGIKYIHGVEVYLTESLEDKIRDNYHTILLAKNYEGVCEINQLIDLSTQPDHLYYKNRITFDEFFNISDNVIKISACLASPLAKYPKAEGAKKDVYDRLLEAYDFYEIQPHVCREQAEYNSFLLLASERCGKPLIVGTDTHSLNQYKAECRSILQKAKKIQYEDEDSYDLTYKTYDELVEMFKQQGAVPLDVVKSALENTNVMASMVEEFELDTSFKYPKLYSDEDAVLVQRIKDKYKYKVQHGIIADNPKYMDHVEEELRVFRKIGMIGFMLFMSELCCWCKENGIPIGFCRGSVGGSVIAYLTDIIDVDPLVWNTIFSRFANEDRVEIGDIDLDISPDQRELVYNHIIESFGCDYTAYVLAMGTISDKGTIDEIGRALSDKWCKNNKQYIKESEDLFKRIAELKDKGDMYGVWVTEEHGYRRLDELRESLENPYSLANIAKIKIEYDENPEETKAKYPELFYYFDGLNGTVISQSMHPAGIICSPVTLPNHYGTFWRDGKRIILINMEEVHEVSLVKYDLLGLKNVQIIRDTCKFAGIPYPLSHEINWNDEDVWKDMLISPAGIFQFEGKYAFDLLSKFIPTCVNDLSLVNASLRPSGESYRDRLLAREKNSNPSKLIDDLLADNGGFLVFQEDTIKFLQHICGLSGSEADNVRRAIGRKQLDRLQAALPRILEGYCKMSPQPRDVAEQEAKAFLQIIEDSSNYQFGYNHSTGYSMIGYMCAYYRYYYPVEFICAYLNNANNEDDIRMGTELAALKGIKILDPEFGHSKSEYMPDPVNKCIYKGVSSIKFIGADDAEALYALRDNLYVDFVDFLKDNPANSRTTEILITLDYFHEFGKSQKLLGIYRLFSNLYGKKQLKKDKCEQYDPDILSKYCDKETDKMYKFSDTTGLISELAEAIPNKDLPLKIRLAAQLEYLGYITYHNPKLKGHYYVTEVNTKYAPVIQCYNLADGTTEIFKMYTKQFAEYPIPERSIIQIVETKKKQRMRKAGTDDTGKAVWEPVPNEWWAYIINYKLK